MIQVCYRGKSSSPELLEKDAFLHLLQREHMPCVAVDIEDRRDLEDILMAAGVTLPQAVLAYQPLGDLQEFSHNLPALRRLVAKKIASGLQSEHSSSLDEYRRDSTVKTGAVDGVMNLLASAASALSSGWTHSQSGSSTNTQTNGSGESTSAGSNAQTTPGSPPVVRATTTHSYIEFTVIKTNWFYRDQLRIIRFGTNGDFHRIEPKTKELKESVPYSTITAISVGPGAITLTLKTGLLHSFRAPQRVIDYMYQLFLAYCPEDVTPTFTQR